MANVLKRALSCWDRLDVRLAIMFLIVVVALMAQAMQPRALDLAQAEAARIAAAEERAYRAWESIWASAGDTWDEEEVARIEKDVLPPWREAHRRVEKVRQGETARYFPDEVEEFFRLREEAWVALIRSVRNQDPAEFRRYEELFRQGEIAGAKVVEIRKREAAEFGRMP